MKVLFLHDRFPAGGAERITIDIANYISPRGYEVTVCAREITHHAVDNINMIQLPDTNCSSSQENIDFIADTINLQHIDVFILPVQAIPEICECIKRKTHAKVVFALHSIPFWELTYRLYEKKNKARGKILKTIGWHLFTYPKMMWGKKYRTRYRYQYARLYQLTDAFTVLCNAYKDMLQRELNLDDNNKIRVIHNSERMIEEYNENKKKQILFVGRFSYEDKRADRLLKIWKDIYRKAEGWQLIMVGDGPERKNLEDYIAHHQLKNVTLAGFHSDVTPYYRDASIICLTSTFEGWGLCLTEAQGHGVVPIAFSCSAGVEEIIAPSGKNGILVPPFSHSKYKEELLSLINDESLLKEMSRNCHKKSMDYSPEITGEKWYRMLKELTPTSLD